MPFVVVACTALFRQPFHKQLYATKLWKLHTQKECTLKPRASVTRISAGTLSPNFTNITSPTTSFSAVMLCFSPSLRTVASCEHFETFCFHELYILEKDCYIMSWEIHVARKKDRKSFSVPHEEAVNCRTLYQEMWTSRVCFLVGTQSFFHVQH